MQLGSCESAVAGGRVPASWSCQRPSRPLTSTKKKQRAAAVACAASRRNDADGSGRLVDEGMAVLRQRIHELRAAEGGLEPPAEWEESDRHGTYYDADVICGLVGALQALIMSDCPGVGVGIVAALALAVPSSAFILATHLLDASRGILSSLSH
jgi:hypothetical protein